MSSPPSPLQLECCLQCRRRGTRRSWPGCMRLPAIIRHYLKPMFHVLENCICRASHVPYSWFSSYEGMTRTFNSTMWNPEIQKSLNSSTFSEQNKMKYNRALGKVSWSALQMELVGRLGTGQLAAAGAARGGCSWFHFYPPCKVISSCLHPPAKQQAFHPPPLLLLSPCM